MFFMNTVLRIKSDTSDWRHPRNPRSFHRTYDRLKCVARLLSTVVAVVIAVLFCSALCAEEPKSKALQRFTFNEVHMGAPWKIVLYAANEAVANHAADAAYARIEELNRILSDYDPNSELSRLSATAASPESIHVSDDLWRVLEFSQQLSEKSNGAFDITIGPLTKLWRHARREKEFPREDLLAARARPPITVRCGWTHNRTPRS